MMNLVGRPSNEIIIYDGVMVVENLEKEENVVDNKKVKDEVKVEQCYDICITIQCQFLEQPYCSFFLLVKNNRKRKMKKE